MNNGLIDEYNQKYDKKLGAKKTKDYDYGEDEEYNSGMEKFFNKVLDEEFEKVTKEELRNNKNYKQAEALVEKYGMLKWSEVAQKNADFMKGM